MTGRDHHHDYDHYHDDDHHHYHYHDYDHHHYHDDDHHHDHDYDPDRGSIDARASEGEHTGTGWPVSLGGVTESIVTTLGPNGRWNCAALGLLAGDAAGVDSDSEVTARTWGRTRTWRNFREREFGYVQFVPDPLVFTEAALSIREETDPILDAAAAWVLVSVHEIASGTAGDGTEWTEWALSPRESRVVKLTVPTVDRGHAAVIEGTVAASRLDVAAYDSDRLLDRLSYLEGVVTRCGGPREREAFSRLAEIVGRRW